MRAVSRGMLAIEIELPLIEKTMIVSVRPTAPVRESAPSSRMVSRPSLPLLIACPPPTSSSNGRGMTDENESRDIQPR